MKDVERAGDAVGELELAMARYVAGDSGAFEALYRLLEPRISRFLAKRCAADAIPDLVQETFLRIHRSRQRFAPGAAVVPWAFTIAKHCVIDAHRLRGNRLAMAARVLDEKLEPMPPPLKTEPHGETQICLKEMQGVVESALRRMTSGRREAFFLVRVQGYSTHEAAVALGASPNAVKIRAHHAARQLGEALAAASLLG
ncbi:MAG: RNA polymerase sigma factor [Polyangiaceae bacterium]